MAPIFDYKAYNRQGASQKGMIEAETSKAARQKLKKMDLLVTDISEKSTQKNSAGFQMPFTGGVKTKDISLITRQLASLSRANIPLVEALNAMVDQTEKEKLKIILDEVRRDVNEGSNLATALSKHPKVFDHIFVNMVSAGESSGTLSQVLMRLADLKEAQVRLQSKVQSAMTYPVLMVLLSVGLLMAIFIFVIPKLIKIFDSMRKALPPTTKALIWISHTLTDYWYVIIAAAIIGFYLFRSYIKTKNGREKWDGFKLKSPVFGSLFQMVAVSRFTRTMGTLLKSGVPIITAMGIAKNLVGNTLIEKAVSHAQENITEGQSISVPLKKSGQFPPLVIHMISVGERTGELPDMLNMISDTYEEQIDAKISGMTALMEPLMIIVMGGIVGFIVFSIFIPLMEISNVK